jgi:hypothetical protein
MAEDEGAEGRLATPALLGGCFRLTCRFDAIADSLTLSDSSSDDDEEDEEEVAFSK